MNNESLINILNENNHPYFKGLTSSWEIKRRMIDLGYESCDNAYLNAYWSGYAGTYNHSYVPHNFLTQCIIRGPLRLLSIDQL